MITYMLYRIYTMIYSNKIYILYNIFYLIYSI